MTVTFSVEERATMRRQRKHTDTGRAAPSNKRCELLGCGQSAKLRRNCRRPSGCGRSAKRQHCCAKGRICLLTTGARSQCVHACMIMQHIKRQDQWTCRASHLLTWAREAWTSRRQCRHPDTVSAGPQTNVQAPSLYFGPDPLHGCAVPDKSSG